MKPGAVATFLGIARSTVTLWTNNDFKQYFTPGAQGGGGNRAFTEQDIRVMYLIKLRKESNTPAAQIHQELQQLRRSEWEGLPDLPDAQQSANVPVIPTQAADVAMRLQRSGDLREIELLNDQLDKANAELAERRGNDERYLREIATLESKLSAAETELRFWREGRLKADGGGG